MQGKLPLIVAIVCGAAAFFGILKVLDSREVETAESRILVFAKDIAQGEIVGEGDLATTTVPGGGIGSRLAGLVPPGSEAGLKGSALVASVRAGTPVIRSLFTAETAPRRTEKFTELLNPGERAISLPVDSAGMVTGLLQPGDYVDILANLDVPVVVTQEINIPNQGITTVEDTRYEPTTVFLLERVRIMAIGSNYLKGDSGEDDSYRSFSGSTVTIAVNARAAQVLSFAMRHGRSPGSSGGVTFTLLLRSPMDEQLTNEREKVTYKNVLEETKLAEIQRELTLLP